MDYPGSGMITVTNRPVVEALAALSSDLRRDRCIRLTKVRHATAAAIVPSNDGRSRLKQKAAKASGAEGGNSERFYQVPSQPGIECSRKKRNISRVAFGPRGSV
jgi:hypothetical protein